MRNKALQLVEIFRSASLWTFEAGPAEHDGLCESDLRFWRRVPDWLAEGPFFPVMPGPQGLHGPEEAAERISERLKSQTRDQGLPDIFSSAAFDAPAPIQSNPEVWREREKMRMLFDQGL